MHQIVNHMHVLAILQARVSSSRLPGKVLLPILGRPMLERQIERIVRCCKINQLVVAISNHPSDDPLAFLCENLNVSVYRGSLNDVLSRFVGAAMNYNPSIIVRLTGDCPLADPNLIDEIIAAFLLGEYDYLSNCAPATYPDGLDVEVFSYQALLEADKEAELPSHREHVTPFIRKQPARYRIGNYASGIDQSHLRWTVDEYLDYVFVKSIYEHLYVQKPDFNSKDVLTLLDAKPELGLINNHFKRNYGVLKSLQADAEYLASKN